MTHWKASSFGKEKAKRMAVGVISVMSRSPYTTYTEAADMTGMLQSLPAPGLYYGTALWDGLSFHLTWTFPHHPSVCEVV